MAENKTVSKATTSNKTGSITMTTDKDATPIVAELDLNSHDYYINRELSHLQFNYRVLRQTLDENHIEGVTS